MKVEIVVVAIVVFLIGTKWPTVGIALGIAIITYGTIKAILEAKKEVDERFKDR